MKSFEAYVHINGTLMVKTVPPWTEGIVDTRSPFVGKYLGKTLKPSLNQAKAYFQEMTGGKSHSIDIEKDVKND